MRKIMTQFCAQCEKQVAENNGRCSECGAHVYCTGARFRLPRRGRREWDKIRKVCFKAKSDSDKIDEMIGVSQRDLVREILGYYPDSFLETIGALSHRQFQKMRVASKLKKNRRFKLTS